MKYLRVTFSNSKVFDIPAEFIARIRAKYYVGKDIAEGDTEEEDREEEIQDEIEYALHDGFEIYDWALNNMNWADVKDVAVCVNTEHDYDYDYESEWLNVDHEIIKKE